MFISFVTISVATLLPFFASVAPSQAHSASVPSQASYEKQQTTEALPAALEFRHRGSGRCELPTCA